MWIEFAMNTSHIKYFVVQYKYIPAIRVLVLKVSS